MSCTSQRLDTYVEELQGRKYNSNIEVMSSERVCDLFAQE